MAGRPEEWALGDTGGLVFPVEIARALLDAEGRRHALAFVRQAIGPGKPSEGWMAALVCYCEAPPGATLPRISRASLG